MTPPEGRAPSYHCDYGMAGGGLSQCQFRWGGQTTRSRPVPFVSQDDSQFLPHKGRGGLRPLRSLGMRTSHYYPLRLSLLVPASPSPHSHPAPHPRAAPLADLVSCCLGLRVACCVRRRIWGSTRAENDQRKIRVFNKISTPPPVAITKKTCIAYAYLSHVIYIM